MLKVYPIALIVLFLTACAESKKVPYLQNIDSVMSAMEKTAQVSDPIFVRGYSCNYRYFAYAEGGRCIQQSEYQF